MKRVGDADARQELRHPAERVRRSGPRPRTCRRAPRRSRPPGGARQPDAQPDRGPRGADAATFNASTANAEPPSASIPPCAAVQSDRERRAHSHRRQPEHGARRAGDDGELRAAPPGAGPGSPAASARASRGGPRRSPNGSPAPSQHGHRPGGQQEQRQRRDRRGGRVPAPSRAGCPRQPSAVSATVAASSPFAVRVVRSFRHSARIVSFIGGSSRSARGTRPRGWASWSTAPTAARRRRARARPPGRGRPRRR